MVTARALTQTLLPLSVALYTLLLFIASSLEGLSKLVHLAMLLVILLLLYKSWAEGVTLKRDPLLVTVWLFLLFAAFSVFWAGDQRGASISAASLFFDILGATLVWLALWNGVTVRVVGYAAALGASIQAVIALNQFYTMQLSAENTFRAEGLTGNANALAIQLSLAAFLILFAFNKKPWAWLLAVVLVAVATVTSGSRTILFVWLVLALLAFQYLGLKFRRSLLFTSLFLILLPVATLLIVTNAERLLKPVENIYVYERFQQALSGREGSANTRLRMIQEGVELWKASPLIGYGINQFRWVSSFTTYSHNNYTELLVSFGLVGLLLYYSVLLVVLLRGGLSASKEPRAWLVIASVLLILFFGISVVYYTDRLMWLFIAVLSYGSASLLRAPAQAPLPRPEKVPHPRQKAVS